MVQTRSLDPSAQLIGAVLQGDNENPTALKNVLTGKGPAGRERKQLPIANGCFSHPAIGDQRTDKTTTEYVAEQPPPRRNRPVIIAGVPFSQRQSVAHYFGLNLVVRCWSPCWAT